MYSMVGILKNPKLSEKIAGTHQKLNRVARAILGKHLPKKAYFPSTKEINHFEGMRGPDGLKIKSPDIDEPQHFVLPENDDRHLIKLILDHQYNLTQALKNNNKERAACEAAWMAHAIVDGLTPAHHFPLSTAVEELMSDKDFLKLFGKPVKFVMRGDRALQTARNNWLYWGAGGYMTKHMAFEYGVAVTVSAMPERFLTPKTTKAEFQDIDLEEEFYTTLTRIFSLKIYDRFLRSGWTSELALETKQVLLPEIVRLLVLAWYSALPKEK